MDPKLWIVNTIVCLEYQSKKDPNPITIFFFGNQYIRIANRLIKNRLRAR